MPSQSTPLPIAVGLTKRRNHPHSRETLNDSLSGYDFKFWLKFDSVVAEAILLILRIFYEIFTATRDNNIVVTAATTPDVCSSDAIL